MSKKESKSRKFHKEMDRLRESLTINLSNIVDIFVDTETENIVHR